MNKMHSVAKIVIGYWLLMILISFCSMVLTLIFQLIFPSYSFDGRYSTLIYSVPYLLLTAFLTYIFIRKRDFLAEKMVGTIELPPPDKKIDWLPTAYRLISVTGGMFCLYRSTASLLQTLGRYSYFKNRIATQNLTIPIPYNIHLMQILGFIVLFIVGIYLVCGAPHFVRWQVKKTLEFCKEL